MRRTLLTALLASALLSGCAPRIASFAASEVRAPADFPEPLYRQALARGERIHVVDASASLVAIEVRRAGSLARLGHDHMIASHDVHGYLWPDAGRADLYLRLDRLVVDEPDLRHAAGFDTEPSADAIVGTRHNMLDKTLDAERFPFAVITVRGVDRAAFDSGLPSQRDVSVSITVHGVTRILYVPVSLDKRDDALQVSGMLTLSQTMFGMTPLSVLGGAIQVRDAVDVRFSIRTEPLH